MRYQLEFKNGNGSDARRALVDESIAHLDRLAAGFRPDALFLRVVIETNPGRALHRVTLKLDIPRRVLVVGEEQRQQDGAIRAAFAELERRLIRVRHNQRSQDSRHPVRLPAAERALATATRDDTRRRESARKRIDQHQQSLQDFVRRELAYRASLGELGPGQLSADEVIEAVTGRAARGRPKATGDDSRGWLTELALNVVDEAVPRKPSPNRSLPTAGEIRDRGDMQEDIARTLATLPRAWRRAFVLHAVEGLTVREVARILRRTRALVEADLNHAREYLRQRLEDAGFVADAHAAQAFFATVPEKGVVETAKVRAIRR